MTEQERLTAYFRYLDELRSDGVTNMFGAAKWLEIAFDLERTEAHETLVNWLLTFGYGKAAERAAMALLRFEANP